MPKTALLSSLASLALCCAQAAMATQDCTDKPSCWPPGSAMHQLLVQTDTLTGADAALERDNQRLLDEMRKSEVHPSDVGLTHQMLKRWKAQRTDECHLLAAATGAGGSWPHAHARDCELVLTKARGAALEKATHCVAQTKPQSQPGHPALRCLRPLMPLSVRADRSELS